MAHSSTIASVPFERIEMLHATGGTSLQATRIEHCSHLLAYWIKLKPLGKILSTIIDGGHALGFVEWPEAFPPNYHNPGDVIKLNDSLQSAWQIVLRDYGPDAAELIGFSVEIQQIADLFAHASTQGEAVVSITGAPEECTDNVVPLPMFQ